MRARTSLYLSIPAALLLAACSSTAPDLGPPEESMHATVTPSLASIDGGATIRLTLTVQQADGTILHPSGAVWRSSDLTVATVGEGGLVRGGSPGLAQISARYQGASGTAMVKVLPTFKGKDTDRPCLPAVGTPVKPSKDECPR